MCVCVCVCVSVCSKADCYMPPPPTRIMHDCSAQIYFQSSSVEFIYLCSNTIPDVAPVTACEAICVCPSSPIHLSVYPLPFASQAWPPPPPTTPPQVGRLASGIWCRLWPCSVPGSRTLTKPLLSTDELLEHTPSPSCVWYQPGLRLPRSTRARSLRSTPPLYLGYKSEAAGNKDFE